MSTLDFLSSLLLLLLLLRCHRCRETDVPEDALADFSVRLYHQLQAGGEQENLVFSPLSMAVGVAMVGLGARGESLEQIRQVAGLSHLLAGEAHSSVEVTFSMEVTFSSGPSQLLLCPPGGEFSLLQNLTAPPAEGDAHHVLRLANSLFLQQGVAFNPDFLRLVRKLLRAEVETVDFSQSEAVAQQINSWVENRTEGESRSHDRLQPSQHGC